MDKITPHLKRGDLYPSLQGEASGYYGRNRGHRYPIEFEKEIRRIEQLFDAGRIDEYQRGEMIKSATQALDGDSFIKNPGKRKAMDDRGLMMNKGGNVDYGLGGALLKLGSNLAQGKGFGSGALKGVGKAAVTPGSGIGAGAELAGNLLQKSKNPALQGIGKGLGVASNFAPGGGGPLGALGGLAGGGAGGAGGIGGALAGLAGGGGGGAGGGGLLNMASQFLGEQGMAVPNEKENMKPMKYSMAAGGYSHPTTRGVKLMKGGAVYADNGVTTPEPPMEDQQVEYILQGGDTPRESKGYFMVGGQRPMDMKELIDMYVSSGISRNQAEQMVQAMKQEGHKYALPDAMNPYRETPYMTEESKTEADRLKNEARAVRARSKAGSARGEVSEEAERRAKELEKQAMNLMGSPDQRFTKVLQPGEMVQDPTVAPLLEGLSKFRLIKR